MRNALFPRAPGSRPCRRVRALQAASMAATAQAGTHVLDLSASTVVDLAGAGGRARRRGAGVFEAAARCAHRRRKHTHARAWVLNVLRGAGWIRRRARGARVGGVGAARVRPNLSHATPSTPQHTGPPLIPTLDRYTAARHAGGAGARPPPAALSRARSHECSVYQHPTCAMKTAPPGAGRCGGAAPHIK